MAEEQAKANDNVILVGRKPVMAYVLATVTQFSNGNNEVQIKARGRAINTAVDVAEIVRRKFLQNVQIKSIQIGTEEREVPDRGKLNVSTITIVIGR